MHQPSLLSVSSVLGCHQFDLFGKLREGFIYLPVMTNFVDIVNHEKIADSPMKAKEPGLPNVRIRALIPLHVGVQPTLGDPRDEVDIGYNPLRGCK
jgi:hypothetical protein